MLPPRPAWTGLRRRVLPGSANRGARAPVPRGPILFLGDSITELWDLRRPGLFAAHDLICRGVSGETSRQVRARLAPALAETNPAGLHLLCGINDIAQNEGPVEDAAIQDNVAAMLGQARAAGVRVWVGSITPCDRPFFGFIDARPRIAAMNAWLRDHSGRTGATYLDYHAVLATPSGGLRGEFGEDGLHLSAAGYAAIEPVLLAALGR
jgi:lysophospholipase L1-like esterase